MKRSPYQGKSSTRWAEITTGLLKGFPIPMERFVKIVLGSWEDIFHSRIGNQGFEIGKHILPEPQIMGFLLHELIPLNLAASYPKMWRKGLASTECDAHCTSEPAYSFEIKTSSSKSSIFGNRSYAHVSELSTKRRGGYMLAVNFEKFTNSSARPEISLIRFGWLDQEDWIGQAAESGQQSRLTKEARAYKLRILYEASKQ